MSGATEERTPLGAPCPDHFVLNCAGGPLRVVSKYRVTVVCMNCDNDVVLEFEPITAGTPRQVSIETVTRLIGSTIEALCTCGDTLVSKEPDSGGDVLSVPKNPAAGDIN